MIRYRLLFIIIITIGFLIISTRAWSENQIEASKIRDSVEKFSVPAFGLFRELLLIPNNARKPEHIARLSNWIGNEFRKRDFTVSRLASEKNPLIFASRNHSNANHTILIYLQADGQPADASAWTQDDPYVPIVRAKIAGNWVDLPWDSLHGKIDPNWRIFARSAADSKAPIVQFLLALDILEHLAITPKFNIKVVIDTEEEIGSPNLPQAVIEHRGLLKADMLLVFDGPPHSSNLPTLKFGARGITTFTLTTFGPKKPLHSGHYGNYAPNPAFHLSRILASMKSENGRVLIEGYYDGIEITDRIRTILNAVPDDEALLRTDLGFLEADKVANSLQLALQYPSLNIRGLSSGWTGAQTRTIVPASATAEMDIRLVKESNPERLIKLIRNHIAKLGYTIIDRDPTDIERRQYSRIVRFNHKTAYPAFRTDFDSQVGRFAYNALVHINDHPPIRIRTSGGSIPISPFVDLLEVPAVGIATVNADNNQHAPDENIRLGHFTEGIAIITAVLGEIPE